MKALGFYIFYGICKPLSLLPYRVLYGLSDVLFVLVYHVVRYRRKVVDVNLSESFPEKTKAELRSVRRKFYRHLCDNFIEDIILMSISLEELNKRMVYLNPEVVNSLYDKNKDVILVLGHYGNWEWPCGFDTHTPYQLTTVYKQLHNPYFDKFFIKLRSRFGCVMVEKKQTMRHVVTCKRNGSRISLVLIGDQAPKWHEINYFTNFLNHPGTPVYMGAERIAKAADMAVVFTHMSKPKRGHYELEFIPLFEEVKHLPPYAITEAHVRVLEEKIREQPELWLWTHKRWKRLASQLTEEERIKLTGSPKINTND